VSKRRVVITGLGVVSALGQDRHGFWSALTGGRSGISTIETVNTETVTFKNGAEIKNFDAKVVLPDKEDLMLDRNAQYGLLAAREAVRDSGIEFDDELRRRGAVVTGCACGGKTTEDEQYFKLYGEKKKRSHPLMVPKVMGNAGASRISLEFGLRGPVFNLSTACSSSNHAIGQAYWLLRDGVADVALAGGHEAFFCLGNLNAWDALRVVAPDTCRPFSRDRLGMVLGEGGAMMVMETLERARARGADIYAEVAGFGMTADAHHLTLPTLEGPASAMAAALRDGDLAITDVHYINAHGTATPANDPNESRAIQSVFGDHAKNLAVTSTKSAHGHALGAAGALEGVATILAIKNGVVPPTINFNEPDPECALDYVPNEAREVEIDGALSNSFAFGGLNAVLAFRRLR
jgi:nodulation protein E